MGLFANLFKPRESASQRAEWLTGTVQRVASQVQASQLQALHKTAQRNFETAETPAFTDSWSTTAVHVNEALSRQLPTLWTRATGLARNNEWAKSYLIALEDNVLGATGIVLQSQLKRDGKKDEAANFALESAWLAWGKNAEVSGLTWKEIECLSLLTLPKRGEMLIRLIHGSGPMGFQIQILDPTLIDVNVNREYQGNRVRMGKEIDDAGKPIAYWLQAAKAGDTPTQFVAIGKHLRIPADQIIHRYITEEVGQLRGIPWLTIGARRLWLLHDFEEAAAVASSNAAKRQGFFYTPDGAAPAGFADTIISSVLDAAKAAGKVLTPEEIQTITAAAEKYNTTVPGQFDTLPHGVQFTPYESVWPNVDAGSYIKQQIRGFAAARGLSYVTAGNDLEAVNYSSARVGILAEREHFKRVQGRLAEWLHQPVFEAALPYLIAHTRQLSAARRAEYIDAATWQPRRWAGIDPVKEATANQINLELKLTSRRRLILERGEDPDEIASETAAEEAIYGPIAAAPIAKPEPDDDDESAVQKKTRLRLAASRGYES